VAASTSAGAYLASSVVDTDEGDASAAFLVDSRWTWQTDAYVRPPTCQRVLVRSIVAGHTSTRLRGLRCCRIRQFCQVEYTAPRHTVESQRASG
jgi:hypothetical protein